MSSTVYEMSTTQGEYTQPIPVKAGEVIPAGAFFGVDTSGRAVPATDATARLMGGRATAEADNSAAGAADGDVTICGQRLAYACDNHATDPVEAADLLKPVFLGGHNTVRKTRDADEPVAGILLGFDGDQPLVYVGAVVPGAAAAPAFTTVAADIGALTSSANTTQAEFEALRDATEGLAIDTIALRAALIAAGVLL